MEFDATLLARIQFAFTVTFHIIFPAFTIGLSAFIATLLVRGHMADDAAKADRLRRLARYWTRIFAVSFAMGVVSGIVLSYQFGTNWSRFSVVVGNVIGPLIGYEVLTAFFLEATFLGIMLFGWKRVPPWLHTTSAIMVAIGTAMSAFWILSANSWMQFPTGHEMRNGIAYPVDWMAIIFNPTFPYRMAHMVSAAYLTTAFVVMAVGARHLLAGRFEDQSRTMLKMGLAMAIILAPLQLVIGDLHGLNTAKYQPTKIAAMEGHWDSSKPAPLLLFAWPDQKLEKNHFEIGIPKLGSYIITHDWNGTFPGLKDVAAQDRPPVAPVFFSFRIMVGLGLLMIGVALYGGFLWWRGRLFTSKGYLKVVSWCWPVGFIAIIAGWMVTEIGRQPWIAQGILRTVDARSPVPASVILISLVLFILVYGVVFSAGIKLINVLVNRGPDPEAEADPEGVPSRPLSAADAAMGETITQQPIAGRV